MQGCHKLTICKKKEKKRKEKTVSAKHNKMRYTCTWKYHVDIDLELDVKYLQVHSIREYFSLLMFWCYMVMNWEA